LLGVDFNFDNQEVVGILMNRIFLP